MAAEHMFERFSEAFDRQLDPDTKHLFDEHIGNCSECAAGYGEFGEAIEALRALPAAAMPVAVHLPETPPVAQATPLWHRLRAFPVRLRVGLGTAIAGLAAAVLLLVAMQPHTESLSTALASPAPAQARNGAAGIAAAVPQADAAIVCGPQGLATQGMATPPTGFDNMAERGDPTRPNQQLVLATQGNRVRAGATVLVFARLTAPMATAGAASGAPITPVLSQSLPCVVLSNAVALDAHAAAGGALSAPGRSFELAAVPTADISVGSAPLQAITIPSGLPSGTTVVLRATVNGGYPHSGDAQLVVELTLTVY